LENVAKQAEKQTNAWSLPKHIHMKATWHAKLATAVGRLISYLAKCQCCIFPWQKCWCFI